LHARNIDRGPLIDPLATIAPEEEPLVAHVGLVGPVLDGLEAVCAEIGQAGVAMKLGKLIEGHAADMPLNQYW
jgi:hypothetical protein